MLSSTPSTNETISGAESIQDTQIQQSSRLAKYFRIGVALSLLAIGVAAGCATTAQSSEDMTTDTMAEILNKMKIRNSGKQRNGSSISFGEGASFSEAKEIGIAANIRILGESNLKHKYKVGRVGDTWIVAVISKKAKVIPKTAEEGYRILLRSMGHQYCGKTNDMVNGCGEGKSEEEAKAKARRKILNFYYHGTFVTPFERAMPIEDGNGTWVAIAQTFPKSTKSKSNDTGPSVTLDENEIEITAPPAPRSVEGLAAVYLNRSKGAFQACHERVLKRDPTIGGKLNAQIEIGKDGKVTRVIFHRKGTTLRNKRIRSCVTGVFKGWKFPKQNQTYSAKIPLIFQAR